MRTSHDDRGLGRCLAVVHMSLVIGGLSTMLAACGGQTDRGETATSGAAGTAAGRGQSASQPTGPTASRPANACGWIPAADVEQVVGKLAGPPKAAGTDCVYPLATKSEAFEAMRQMRQRTRQDSPSPKGETSADDDSHLADVVRVTVNVKGEVIDEMAMGAVGKKFARELGQRPSGRDTGTNETESRADGWDAAGGLPYAWSGRVGHVKVIVSAPPEISDETKALLAARVRDRIPDLPFPTETTYQVPDFGSGNQDPCSLLTRVEAEAVLGPLVVDPYRSIESTPLAYSGGKGCAFFTAGHHVFVVTPVWSDGQRDFNMERGLGALMSQVLPREAAVLKGPWDKATISGATGTLLFLKGDRLLKVDYLTSSTDREGALKLAAPAIQRLAS